MLVDVLVLFRNDVLAVRSPNSMAWFCHGGSKSQSLMIVPDERSVRRRRGITQPSIEWTKLHKLDCRSTRVVAQRGMTGAVRRNGGEERLDNLLDNPPRSTRAPVRKKRHKSDSSSIPPNLKNLNSSKTSTPSEYRNPNKYPLARFMICPQYMPLHSAAAPAPCNAGISFSREVRVACGLHRLQPNCGSFRTHRWEATAPSSRQ